MLRNALLAATLFFMSSSAQAQSCVPGDISLASQMDVDDFQSNYGPCDQVSLQLNISGFDISSLQPLIAITGVNSLAISTVPALGSLGGLDNLNSVNFLFLSGPTNLVNLSGLGSLDSVSSMFHIQNNDSMVNLSGLPTNMTALPSLLLEGNDNLSSLEGFPSVTSGMDLIAVVGNSALTSLNGMPASIDSLATLSIVSNENLASLDGLSAIGSLQETLGVSANPALKNLLGLNGTAFSSQDPANPTQSIEISSNTLLSGLDGIPASDQFDNLEITNNPSLTTLAPLDGVQEVWGLLYVTGNTGLVDCSVLRKVLDDVDDGPAGPGPLNPGDPPDVADVENVLISGNGPGCNSIEEILNAPPDPLIFENDFESDG